MEPGIEIILHELKAMRHEIAELKDELYTIRSNGADIKTIVADLPTEVPRKPLPEFIRIPTKGRCSHTGFSRSKIYRLLDAGMIKRKIAKTLPTDKKGTAYILGSSVESYFSRLPTK